IDRALRRVTVARGYDPRDFTLVTFGGAGALHACDIADRLQIPRVLVPRYPGVLCAYGLLVADVVIDYSRSVLGLADADSLRGLAPLIDALYSRAQADLQAEGIAEAQRHYAASVDARYHGQAYELNIPLDSETDILAAFHAAHRQVYGHDMPARAVEVVNLRLRAVGVVPSPALAPEPVNGEDEFAGARYAFSGAALLGEKTAPDGVRLDLLAREHLLSGARFDGAALVFQLDSTTYVPPGWSAYVDGYRNLILERMT
ncbi:MAG: hydantoinase/oxoprolinase family protein, partial [Phototrophicaceae bacterium]